MSKRLNLVEDSERFADKFVQFRNEVLSHYSGGLALYAMIRARLVPIDFFRQLSLRIPAESHVMDIGSGAGLFTLILARLRPDLKILGVELQQNRVDESNRVAQLMGISNVEFAVENLYDAKFHESFDAIIALDVLHHIELQASNGLVGKVFEALRGSGTFWVKEIDTRPRWRWLFTYLLDLLMASKDRFSYFSLESRIGQMQASGFRQVEGFRLHSHLPYPHICVVAHK
jgi:cyclopropane fatty-acyl-phospholipid synthase-like methyltransferase